MPCRFAHHSRACWLTVLAGFWLSVCAVAPVCAQYRFDHWTTEQGLPQNQVNAITQTRDGYLWLATNDGLARFDGVRFTIFNRSNAPGRLESNRLSSLYEDRQGRLWVGSEEKGLLICYQAGKFTSYTERDGLPLDQLVLIEEDEAGRLWLSGRYHNLVELRDSRFITRRPADYLPGVLAPRAMNDRCWWSQDERGVHIFTRGRRLSLTRQDGLPSLQINSIKPDQHGTLWIGTHAGLVRVKDGQLSVIPVHKYFLGKDIGALCYEDRQGNIWYPTATNLQQWRADGFISFAEQVRGSVGPIYEDREGSIWFGTETGLYRVRPLPVRTLTEAPEVPSHLTDLIYSVLEDRSGNVWLGKWGGGLSRYRAGRFTHYVGGADWLAHWSGRKAQPDNWHNSIVYTEGLFGSRVTSLYEDRTGVIWVGTESNEASGVSRLANGKFTRYSAQHGLAQTWAMLQDRAGDFWFATTTGLTRQRNNSFTVYTTQDGLPANECHALFEDRQGRLWIGTQGGLARWEQSRFSAWTERDGLAGKQVRSLYEDEQGTLWIGTYDGGLTRFKDGHLTPYTSKQGLFNDGISHILDDGCGNFWLSSNRGIFRVSQAELHALAEKQLAALTSVAYGVKDGMLKAECNGGRQPSGWRLRNGQLWFPTMEGVAIIAPTALRANRVPPPVVIEEARLDQQPLALAPEPLQLGPEQHNLEIQYTGLSLLQAESVKFKYQLEGLDREWLVAGPRRVVNYSHLPPGAYTFKVLAANSDGVWSEQAASLRFVIKPRFYQTWWFWLALLGGTTAAGLLLYRQRLAQVERRHAEQAAAAGQLVTSLENDRQRIAKDLHDNVGGDLAIIKSRAQHALSKLRDPEITAEHLAEIAERAGLVGEEIHEIIYDLYPLHLERKGLAKSIEELAREATRAGAPNFELRLATLDKSLSRETRLHLYRIIREGINNILKHSAASAALIVLKREAAGVLLLIQDNGKGFDVAAAVAGGKPGFGLNGLRERARFIGGDCQIRSVPGQGTTITLKLSLEVTRDEK